MTERKRLGAALLATALLIAVPGAVATSAPSSVQVAGAADDCNISAARRYVAGGDGVVKGTHSSETDRFPKQLLDEHLTPSPGPWCVYNTSTDPGTTSSFVTGSNSQQSQAWNLRPNLITLSIGRQNSRWVDQIDKCFKNIKDHDFLEANTCALAILADTGAATTLRNNLSNILNKFKTQMAGSPNLVVAVTGYYNPYPAATSVATKIPGFCAQLQDTIPTCIARWVQLPPALVILDQVVKRLNATIEPVVKQFRQSSQGRFFFVNPYDKFKDHCMTMNVTIKTRVYHPPNTVHQHDTQKTNFGCSENWVASDGNQGTKSPFLYLTPAVTGVLLTATQTTEDMGFNPNADGHDCISDLIWEAVKNKLGVPEPPAEDSEVCDE